MEHLKFLFKSLYKNDYCIDGGRKYKWWVALIFFFLSTIIAIIPLTVSLFTQDAGTTITSASMDTDKGFVSLIEKLNEDGITLTFHNSNVESTFDTTKKAYVSMGDTWTDKVYTFSETISVDEDSTSSTTEEESSSTSVQALKHVQNKKVQQTVDYFHIYLINVGESEMSDRILCVLQGLNPTLKADDGSYISPNKESSNYKVTPSFLIIGRESMAFYKYALNTTSTYANPKTAILVSYSNVKVNTFNSLYISGQYSNTITNISQFIKDAYWPTLTYNGGIQLSIYLTIDVAMIFLMGLVLFIMTRGKQNPFRIYKFHECIKIACWESFSPALIALILGFILSTSTLSAFFFALLLGLRTMWLGMKNLRPMPQA